MSLHERFRITSFVLTTELAASIVFMLVISKFPDNDLLVIVDIVSATDIGNTLYLRDDVILL